MHMSALLYDARKQGLPTKVHDCTGRFASVIDGYDFWMFSLQLCKRICKKLEMVRCSQV